MEVELESELGGHKRADPEGVANVSDAKRPREGNNGLHGDGGGDDDDDDDYFPPVPNPLDAYRETWIALYGSNGASYEDETELLPMHNTDGPVLPLHVKPMHTMQVFSVKVTQITTVLRWPLDIYGVVAVHDSRDNKRNVLFRRDRDQCQTLTSLQDSLLELIGPSRAVLMMDPPVFEIDLRVKSKESASEDKALSYYAFVYNCIVHRAKASYAITEVVPSEHSTMEVRFAHLADAVEATVELRLVSGSTNFSARFTARTASIDEDVLLLDTHGGKVSVADDGIVALQRRVLVVEERGVLFLGIEAAALGGDAAESSCVVQKRELCPRSALRSESYFNLGFSRLRVIVAWSMLP